MTTTYERNLSLRDALRRYFDDNGFGADGGYNSSWVELKVGPIPLPFPNTSARKKAVPFHDLHHIATGYGTDWSGEAEISAWELGAGCKNIIVAWQLNLSMAFVGCFFAPKRTFKAFVRGRRSRSFYGEQYEPLLALSVAEAKTRTAIPETQPHATPADAALFGATMLGGLGASLVSLALFLPLAPFGIAAGLLAKRRAMLPA
jgi:hypothetical protein